MHRNIDPWYTTSKISQRLRSKSVTFSYLFRPVEEGVCLNNESRIQHHLHHHMAVRLYKEPQEAFNKFFHRKNVINNLHTPPQMFWHLPGLDRHSTSAENLPNFTFF